MKKILLSVCLLAGTLLFSCQSDGNEPENPAKPEQPGQPGTDGEKMRFELNLTLPGTSMNIYTRAESTPEENEIYSLHLAFFERTNNGSGAYKGFYSVNIPVDQPLDFTEPIPVEFTPEHGLSHREAYNIFVVANLEYYLRGTTLAEWKESIKTMTESQMVGSTLTYVEGEPNETVYRSNLMPLPMSAKTYKLSNEESVDVVLDRAVARFDILNYVKERYDLRSASIWNGYPDQPVWTSYEQNSYNASRIRRYYGVKATAGQGGYYDDIEARLYSFENYVAQPDPRDEMTTCIIIGLSNRDITASDYGKTLYYRVNIHPTESAQSLTRNNSYNVVIRDVADKGYNTEEEAFKGDPNKLNIVINYWDLDDDGIIQYDGDNVLAVPMKRINIPRPGDEREYSIFTFGNGNLNISKNTLPAGISATLSGNVLTVVSEPLPVSMDERSGQLELSFATLSATITVRQSGDIDMFVSIDPTDLSVFPAQGPTQSEAIKVSASGPWKAKLYNPGFSFAHGSIVTEVSSETHPAGFTVSTLGNNTDPNTKIGFLVVSLNEDPGISRNIILRQRGRGGIEVIPNVDYLTFNPDGSLASGTNTFVVNSGDNGEEIPTVNQWSVTLDNNTWFDITNLNYDPSNAAANTFTVAPTQVNSGTTSRTATMKVFLANDPSVYKQIQLTQAAYNFGISQTTFSPIPASGGSTPAITMTAADGMTWSATVTTNHASHKATLSTNVRPNGVYQLSGVSMNEQLYVSFPRLTVSGVSPVATVTVRLDGTNLEYTFTVTQNKLSGRSLSFHSYNTGYSTLVSGHSGYSYINIFGDNLKNWRYFGKEDQSVVKTAGAIGFTKGHSIPSGTTNYHANEGVSSCYVDDVVNWMGKDRRNFMTVCVDIDQSTQQKMLRRFSGSYTVASAGIKTKVKRTLGDTPARYRNNKVWEYLTKTGPFTNGVELNINNTAFYNGDSCNGYVTSWPSTAIPVIMHPDYKDSRAFLVIDPVNRLVVSGDNEMFCRRNSASNMNDYAEGSDNWKFLNNLLAFIVNAGQYGDDFLDEFRE